MKKNIGLALIASLAIGWMGLATGASAQSASQLDPTRNTVALWQTNSGNWRACGPSQCIRIPVGSIGEAIRLVAPDSASGYSLRGSIGNCRMYQSGNETRSWENSAQRVLDLAPC